MFLQKQLMFPFVGANKSPCISISEKTGQCKATVSFSVEGAKGLTTFTAGDQLFEEEENTIVSASDKHVLAEAASAAIMSFLFWRKMQLHSLPSVTLLLLHRGRCSTFSDA